MMYTKLLPLLLQSNLIAVVPLKLVEPSYSKSYDPNTKCDYHWGGVIGHSTKRCWGLKHKVQGLINGGWLWFQEREPNVNSNPLPTHAGLSINTIGHEYQGQEPSEVTRKETSKGRGEKVHTFSGLTDLVVQLYPRCSNQAKQYEYELLDQMNKTPARISLLSLLINSKGHRKLLLKILNEAHVAQDIIIEKFRGIPSLKKKFRFEGKGYNQPLHIAVKCGNFMIARVLINNGCSLNVLPKTTLNKLYSTSSQLGASSIMVRAFDGSKRQVMGEIMLLMRIRPVVFDITFQVKFIAGQQLINVMGEKELMISTLMPADYLEGDVEALETSFQSLEIASTTSTTIGQGGPKPSRAKIMAARPSKGLGCRLKGITKPVTVRENPGKAGLGYQGVSVEEGPHQKTPETQKRAFERRQYIPRPNNNDRRSASILATMGIDNVTLVCGDTNQSDKPIKGEDAEVEAEDLEGINLGIEMEKKEVWVGKQMPPEFRHFCMVIPGHARPGSQNSGTRATLAPKLYPGLTAAKNDEARSGIENQGRSRKAMEHMVPSRSKIPSMGGKHSANTQERWKGVDVDLNRVSPKDNFPLPHIDVLVDNTAQHAFFSFMDDFFGYNQIQMSPKDREETTFITLWGTFCYKVMSFVLKNAGATYQRAMIALFHDMIHKEIEVYVDDMIAKLRKYKHRLNPTKCTFGVKSKKLLGFVANEKGIEVDSNKVKAIREMSAPRIELEVCEFLGRVNYIVRFIFQLTATCEPIFKLLHKKQKMGWNSECQEAFKKIKMYLEKPPVLDPTVPRKPLILYLTSPWVVSWDNTMPQERKNMSSTTSAKNSQIARRGTSTITDLLHPSLGNEKAKTVHVGPHHVANI
ncbi:hypothetical protein CR513_39010, partial [Mucuna pruriens]